MQLTVKISTNHNYAEKTILAQAVDGIHPCVAILGSHICKADIQRKKEKRRLQQIPLIVMKTTEKN